MGDKVKIQVSIDKELWYHFKDICKKGGIKQSTFLEYVLTEFIDKGDVKYVYKE